MGDTDIVLQGGYWKDYTYKAALDYANLDFVNNVIISCSIRDSNHIERLPSHQKIKWALTPLPENPGMGNMNIQIETSRAGIGMALSDVVVKTRSDQHITQDSMYMMHRFFNRFESSFSDLKYYDSECSVSPIFTVGLLSTFPYHPQDHLFWGYREEMTDLFDLPFVKTIQPHPSITPDYKGSELRCPIHLGSHYCARFNPLVQTHIDNDKEYLVDNAPKRNEAMKVWHTLRDRVFKVFPRIDMYWCKYNSGYWYREYEPQGEYYHDEPWE